MPLKRHIEKFVDSNLWDSFWKGLKHHNSSEDDSTQDINTLNTFTSALPNQIVFAMSVVGDDKYCEGQQQNFHRSPTMIFLWCRKVNFQPICNAFLSPTLIVLQQEHQSLRITKMFVKKPFVFVIYDSLLSSPSLASVISSGSVPPFLILRSLAQSRCSKFSLHLANNESKFRIRAGLISSRPK